ncbi:MAG: STAS domain-containing protein [Planctomycetota bacterium JB042]
MNDTPAARLDIELTEQPPGLRLSGDIDSHTAPDLAEALGSIPADRDVELDMAGVGFIDSSGLRVLVADTPGQNAATSRFQVARFRFSFQNGQVRHWTGRAS